jgi:choline monooxygenase
LDKVEKEDQYVVEATQLGLISDTYSQGRYSPEKEKGVHHFHRLLINSLR